MWKVVFWSVMIVVFGGSAITVSLAVVDKIFRKRSQRRRKQVIQDEFGEFVKTWPDLKKPLDRKPSK